MTTQPPTTANGKAQTGPQSTVEAGGSGFASAVTQLAGFGPSRKGGWNAYREMSAHPTIALVQAVSLKPIERSPWAFNRKPDAPADRQKFVEDMFTPLHNSIVRDSLDAVPMGCSMFEKVWAAQGRFHVLTELKPLALEKSKIRVTTGAGGGKFAGIENVADDVKAVLDPINSWLYTHDAKQGNLYGRSRHENIRKQYGRSEEIAEKFARYLQKISGIIFQLHYPDSGTSLDQAGAARPNWWLASDLLQKVSEGQNVALGNKFASFLAGENGHVTPALLEKALAAAGKSDWVFSFLQPGGPDYAEGFLSTLAYYDKLFFRGWLRPERTALEAQRGGIGQGDSEQHSEVGMLDTEAIAGDLARAFNKGVIDDVLALNFGEDARGSVWVEPTPLIDTTMDNALKLIEAALSNQQLAPSVAMQIDWDALLADLEIPVAGKAEQGAAGVPTIPQWSIAARMRQMLQQAPVQLNTPNPAGGQIVPQNGRTVPQRPGHRVQKMSRAAVRRARRVMEATGWEGATK
jgi:hypothetical protein